MRVGLELRQIIVLTGRFCCRDVDSWAEFAEGMAKGQDRKFSRGGFSEDLSSLSGLGESSNSGFDADLNPDPAADRLGKQQSILHEEFYLRMSHVIAHTVNAMEGASADALRDCVLQLAEGSN